MDCSLLQSVVLPAKTETVAENAFSNCPSLTEVTFYNSSCDIFDEATTICTNFSYSESGNLSYSFRGTIYGYDGSTAEAHAEKYKLKFVSLGAEPETTTTSTSAATTTTKTTTTAVTTTTSTASTTSSTSTASSTTQKTTTASATTAPVTTTTGTADGFIAGDVNDDTIVDARDASNVLADYAKTSTGKDSIFSDIQRKAADVYKDDIVDARDASLILAYYAMTSTGKDVTFEDLM